MKEKIINILVKYFIGYAEIVKAAAELEPLINQEVEKRIAERLPSEGEIEKHFTTPHYHYERGHYYKVRKDRIFGAKWLRSLLTQPNNSEGGERKKFTCYEIWRPNIPDDGCKEQCKECAEREKAEGGEK